MNECSHCGNCYGFVFGTCIMCGWNGADAEFKMIRVSVDDLPPSIRHSLVARHAQRTRRMGDRDDR